MASLVLASSKTAAPDLLTMVGWHRGLPMAGEKPLCQVTQLESSQYVMVT